MCHGRDAAEKAEATAHETFEGGGTSADLPSVAIDAATGRGLGLLEAFVIAGLAKSNGEARRLVQGGGAKVNDASQNDIAATLTEADVQEGSIKLSFGKKRHVLFAPKLFGQVRLVQFGQWSLLPSPDRCRFQTRGAKSRVSKQTTD